MKYKGNENSMKIHRVKTRLNLRQTTQVLLLAAIFCTLTLRNHVRKKKTFNFSNLRQKMLILR